MTVRTISLLAVLLSSALLAACSTPGTRVVLLPQADGKPSAVQVSTEDGAETLAQPFDRATAKLGAKGAPVVDKVDPERVKRDNKLLFDLMPPPAQLYAVYFEAGGTVLTPASQVSMNEALEAAVRAAAARSSARGTPTRAAQPRATTRCLFPAPCRCVNCSWRATSHRTGSRWWAAASANLRCRRPTRSPSPATAASPSRFDSAPGAQLRVTLANLRLPTCTT